MLRRGHLRLCVVVAVAVACGRKSSDAGRATPGPVTLSDSAAASRIHGGRAFRHRTKSTDSVVIRPEQAPIATVRDIIGRKVGVGHRIRVRGRCTAAGIGRDAGLWTLADSGIAIEVRGLVPRECPSTLADVLTIFAQVESANASGSERLLLRLPD